MATSSTLRNSILICFLLLAIGNAVKAQCDNPSIYATMNEQNCRCDAINGTAWMAVTAGTYIGTMSYQWNTGVSGTQNSGAWQLLNVAPGTYSVTATDSRGCAVYGSITVGINRDTLVYVMGADSARCNTHNGDARMALFAGTFTPPAFYEWNNGVSGYTAEYQITNLAAGTYICTATDADGCISIGKTHVGINHDTLIYLKGVDSATCNGPSGDARIALFAGTYTPPAVYSWSNGVSGTSNFEVYNLTPGTYTVTATDADGCSSTASMRVGNIQNTIVPNVTTTNTNCRPSGTASVSPTGGNGPYHIQWSTGATGYSISNLASANYGVTIADAYGCSVTALAQVSVNTTTAINPNITTTPAGCAPNGSATASPSGGTPSYTYAWDNGSTSSTITNIPGGTYVVTITDQGGCTATGTADVADTGVAINAHITTTPSHCRPDGTATASPTGGAGPYDFMWSNGATTATADSLAAENYSVTITDANGCSGVGLATVTPFTTTAIVANDSTIPNICFYGFGGAWLSPTGGNPPYTYMWSNGVADYYIDMVASGPYSFTITDSYGCTTTGTVNVNDSITQFDINVYTTPTICLAENGTARAVVEGESGPYGYEWSTGETTSAITGLPADAYTITVFDLYGCIDSATVIVSDSIETFPVSVNTDPALCGYNGAADALAGGGTPPYEYAWSIGATTQQIDNLVPGPYSVTITDDWGCTAEGEGLVTDSVSTITLVTSSTPEMCTGVNGTATVVATGGAAPYSYFWNDGQTTPTADILPAGDYSVTVVDNDGCSAVADVTVDDTTATITPHMSSTAAGCTTSIGTATAAPTGGTAPYFYAWNTGAATATIAGLPAAIYTVLITDFYGCTVQGSVAVPAGTLSAAIVSRQPLCNASNGMLMATASGGAVPYAFAWSTGGTLDSIHNLAAGTYRLTLTDNSGCRVVDSLHLTPNPGNFSATATAENVTCSNHNGVAIATGLLGTFPYHYSWSTGDTTSVINGLGAGTYTVTVNDANGCLAVKTVNVNASFRTIALQVINKNPVCAAHNGYAQVFASGGTAPYKYQWSNSDSTALNDSLAAGIYQIIVHDANGCMAVLSDTLASGNGNLQAHVTTTPAICNSGNGSATALATGGTAGYAYHWSRSAQGTGTILHISPGIITVTVTDANNCSAVASDTIGTTTGNMLTFMYGIPAACNSSNGMAYVNVSNGAAPLSFAWSNSHTTDTITNLAGGTYHVTVTDANGCTSRNSINLTSPGVPNVTLSWAVLGGDTFLWGAICPPGFQILTEGNPPGGTYSGLGIRGDTLFFGSGAGLNYGRDTIVYTYIDGNGCGDSASNTLLVEDCEGIPTINLEVLTSVYPNPSTGQVTVTVELPEVANLRLEWMDIIGDRIMTERFSDTRNFTKTYDFSKYATGVYLLRISTGEAVITKRVAISR